MEMLLSALLVVASYSVQGTIALDSGAPIDSPFLVQLIKGATTSVDCVYTSPGGVFAFQDVPAGPYYIRVQREGFEDAFQPVDVPVSGPSPSIVMRRRRNSGPQDDPQLGDRHRVNVRQLATPSDAVRHYEKATADLKEGKTEHAIWHLQRAVQIAPDFLEAAYRLGDVFYENSRFPEAEQLLAKTLTAVPSEQRLHLLLARVLVRQHKYAEALVQVDAWLQSGAKDPDPGMVQRFRARLSRHLSN